MTPAPVRPTVDGPSARRRLPRSPWRLVVATWLVGAAGAAEPAQVLVVANRASAASVDLAEYYVRKRAIPLANLCLVPAPRTEAISRTEYQALEEAVRRCWHARRKTVAYVLLMPQVPLRISPSAAVPHPQTDQASVDSELALLPRVAPSRAGPLPNPYFQRQTDPFDPQRYGMLLVTRLAAQSLDHLRRLIDDSLRAGRDPALAATGRIVLDATDASDRPGKIGCKIRRFDFPKISWSMTPRHGSSPGRCVFSPMPPGAPTTSSGGSAGPDLSGCLGLSPRSMSPPMPGRFPRPLPPGNSVPGAIRKPGSPVRPNP